MNADGNGEMRLTTTSPFNSSQPSWSPDGRRLLLRSNRDGDYDVWAMNADGTNAQQVLNDPGDERYPAFSPSGQKIVFISDRDGDYEIYTMDATGANVVQLTNNAVLDAAPAWSPDGSKIAFRSERDAQSEIYVMAADGSNQRRLTEHLARDEGPAWSPDGTRMAFTTERDGNQEIYVMQSDGSGPVNLTNAPSQELSPDWQTIVQAGPPVGGQVPSGQPSIGDRTAPRLRLRARSRQRALRRRAVIVSASCNESCSLTASGTVRIAGQRGRPKLEQVRRRLAARAQAILRLRPSRAARGAMRRALRRDRKVTATISIRARDSAGNTRSARRVIRIVG
jgi:hypothetical protein